MTLDFFTVELDLEVPRQVHFGPFEAANFVRGQLGKRLYGDEAYVRLFSPPRRDDGPSGLADPPRPFVLRAQHLDGCTFHRGDSITFGVHVFDLSLASLFPHKRLTFNQLELSSVGKGVQRMSVKFLTPTYFKNEAEPSFGTIISRLRDRVSTLRALYGVGPLEIDFKSLGNRAEAIRCTLSEFQPVTLTRHSESTQQSHPYGGFIGEAIYEGDLDEFMPYLRAGFYIGVGRHTAWGNGQIRPQLFP